MSVSPQQERQRQVSAWWNFHGWMRRRGAPNSPFMKFLKRTARQNERAFRKASR